MGMTAFFDTNIFVYSVSAAPEDAAKRGTALDLIAESDIHLSLQVVQEFINVCLRKKRIGHNPDALQRSVRRMFAFTCQFPTADSVLRALDIQKSHAISFWDASIVAAARELHCHTLYTEDLTHGQEYDGVKVINPFL